MAEIIDLNTKTKTISRELTNPISVKLLQDFHNNSEKFEELIICFKKSDGSTGIIDTMPSLEDKCLFLQMLQHQIISNLARTSRPINPESVTSTLEELD